MLNQGWKRLNFSIVFNASLLNGLGSIFSCTPSKNSKTAIYSIVKYRDRDLKVLQAIDVNQ